MTQSHADISQAKEQAWRLTADIVVQYFKKRKKLRPLEIPIAFHARKKNRP